MRRKGFTLIETAVTMVIIGLLLLAAVPFLKTLNQNMSDISAKTKTQVNLLSSINEFRNISTKLDFYNYIEKYPSYEYFIPGLGQLTIANNITSIIPGNQMPYAYPQTEADYILVACKYSQKTTVFKSLNP